MKYSCITSTHLFIPIVVEVSGIFGKKALSFITELGLCLRLESGEPASLVQKISVAMQGKGNAAAILGSMGSKRLAFSDFLFCQYFIF